MQTVREQAERINISKPGLRSFVSPVPDSSDHSKRFKIREFISWSVCFAVISLLTGLLMILKVGITMETVTASLFFLSLGGLIYFIYRIIVLSKKPVLFDPAVPHELN
jgi:hypothetical protein